VLPTYADERNLYGPIRSGQSLSQIAMKIRPDSSVTMAQILSTTYDLNPEAFDKGNMNLLKKGVKLRIPDKEEMLSITHQQAKRQVANHAKALKALLADAKKLNLTKKNYKIWKIKVYKLQKRLNRQKHKGKTWRRTYKKLTYAKKKRQLAQEKIKILREKLLAKAVIKVESETTISSPSSVSTSIIAKSKKEPILTDIIKTTNKTQKTPHNKVLQSNLDEMDSRINKVQKQMQSLISTQKKETHKRKQQIANLQTQLKVSNKKLDNRITAQTKMEERLVLLENELGQKEKIILTLRSALMTAANTMKKQQVENQKLQDRLKKLNPEDTLLQYGKLQLHDSNSTHIDEKY
jgi:pilus assembly protein FimV